jgi:tetratricopeptide (TPR) repeat protein
MTVLLACLLAAVPIATVRELVSRGYEHFYNLEYQQALADFEGAAAQEPGVPDLHNHIAQALLYSEMHRNGALESEMVSGNNSFLRRPAMNPPPEIQQRFHDEIRTAMELSQARLREDPADTGALYAMGVAHGLRANYNFLVRKAWRDALRDATAGRKLHNRVTELEPANVDARLMQGVHDYVVGSLPLFYRMLGFVVGFRGDKSRGLRTLEEVARNGSVNRLDASFLLCALYRREGQPRRALPLLEELARRFPRNYLLRFEQAQMHSAAGNKDEALAAVAEVGELKEQGAPGYAGVPWEKIYFHAGTIEFWYNDLDAALEKMRKVTQAADRVDLNTGVLAWMRLGQIYDLRQQRALALEAYRSAIEYAPSAEAARESRRYLASPYRRGKS